jgi:hypothetical protein
MTTKKAVITNKKLSTNKACPKPFKNTFGHLMNELADMKQFKPATILYKKLPDDMILITGFENFLDIEGILDKYGRKVASTYTAYPYNMSGVDVVIFPVGLSGITSIRTGYVCNKSGFSKIVSHVKKCGGLLHDIIAAVNSGEVKRIQI